MLISRAHHPVLTLGYGCRAGIWTQGCVLACEGCIARDTWDANPANDVPVAEILRWLASHPDVDGVTISGGEPLDQPVELAELLRGIRALWPRDVDVLCFTGRSTAAVRHAYSAVTSHLDAIVTGPYVRTVSTTHPLMGSGNQELVCLTDLGHERYATSSASPRLIQASSSGNHLWTVGVPGEGDLAQLEEALESRSLRVARRSWDEPEDD